MRAEEAPDAMLRRMLSGKAEGAGSSQMSASEMHEALVKQMTHNQGIVASVLVESLRTLKSVVDSLDRLGSAIRQSSSAERLTERIQKYMKRSDDSGVLEDIVYLRLKHMLVDGRKYRDEELPDNAREATLLLCRQLAVSVAYRYSAIMYRRHHEQKRVARRDNPPQELQRETETQKDVAQQLATVRHKNNPHLLGPTTRPSAIPSRLRPALSEHTVSMLSRPESAVVMKKYASSQASFVGATSVMSIQPGNVTLPKPPTIVAPAVDAACPYCLVRFHKDMYAKQHWWGRHVQRDLKLYTCISEDCYQPPVLFASYAEWKKHMDDTHTHQWTMNVHSPASSWCGLDHDEEWFSNERDYESHMLARHANQFEGYDMDDMKELASAKQPRTWNTCPVCNCVPPIIKNTSTNARGISTDGRQQREDLLKHIGQHLKEIGLLSVGYLDDDDGGDPEASRNASVASLRSRNYVPKAGMFDGAWAFDDTGLADYVDVDYKSSDVLLTDTQRSDLPLAETHTSSLPDWQVLWKADLLDEEQTLRDRVDFAEKWRSPPEVAHSRKALESWLYRFDQTQKLYEADNVIGNQLNRRTVSDLSPEDEVCIRDLCLTDPYNVKKRIERAKGGLLRNSCRWILEEDSFQEWCSGPQGRILWIRGDPGKGKTMLLCSIIDELDETEPGTCLSYFFCQATDTRLNNATAVLRGLIYMLIFQRPNLIIHVRNMYDITGRQLFEDNYFWPSLCNILTDMLCDEQAADAILVIDALDECTSGLAELLRFICRPSSAKWIVSSRNSPDIEHKLTGMDQNVLFRLELDQRDISDSVAVYVQHRVEQLADENKYDDHTKDALSQYLTANADGTFFWAAFVCTELANRKVSGKNALNMAMSYPMDLSLHYRHMMAAIHVAEDRDICEDILATALIVYRPIALAELPVLCTSLEGYSLQDISEAVQSCGPFLIVSDGILRIGHQSAKNYLVDEAAHLIFPSDIYEYHAIIASRSLTALSSNLRRDIYGLNDPGYCIDKELKPDHDPLAAIRYACLFWVDHLVQVDELNVSLQDGGQVHIFLQEKFLYWLEALSLLGRISDGVSALHKLSRLVRTNSLGTDDLY